MKMMDDGFDERAEARKAQKSKASGEDTPKKRRRKTGKPIKD